MPDDAPQPPGWSLYDGDRLLLRLVFTVHSDGWACCDVHYESITPAEWQAAERQDWRDIMWEFEHSVTRQRYPYCSAYFTWCSYNPDRANVKWIGVLPPSEPPGVMTWIRKRLGLAVPTIPLQRSPLSNRPVRWRVIRSRLLHATDHDDLAFALEDLSGFPHPDDVPHIAAAAARALDHRSKSVRCSALHCFAELARQQSFVPPPEVLSRIEAAASAEDLGGRHAAAKALDAIRRFGGTPPPWS
jgi:hypothetical protein